MDGALARPICLLFFAVVAACVAAESIRQEVATGEPALKGLVHAGIAALVAIALCTHKPTPLPYSFALFAMLIGCGYAIARRQWWLLHVLFVCAAETWQRAGVAATGAYFAMAAAQLVTMSSDAIPFTFHSAFVCSISCVHADTAAVQLVVAASMAVVVRSTPAAPMYAAAAVRALWCALDRSGVKGGEYVVLERHATSSPVYVASTLLYGASLLADAWTCCAIELLTTTTRMLHVAAVCATLVHVVPSALDALPQLRYPLLCFPVADASLCLYRVYGGAEPSVLTARGASALMVGASVGWSKRTHASHCPASPPESPPESSRGVSLLRRASCLAYVCSHTAYALVQHDVDRAMAILFHFVVVVHSLAWMGLESLDHVALHLARVFLATECVAMGAVLVVDPTLWWPLCHLVTSAALLCCVATEKGANRYDGSSLFSFVGPDRSTPGTLM